MKGEKGICVISDLKEEIRRTKFNTEENCKEAYDSHKNMGIIPHTYVIYKCKACGFYHFGKSEWSIKYGINE